MKQKLGELTAKNKRICEDTRGRTIITDRKNNLAYIVEKEDERVYSIISSRITIAFAVGILAWIYLGIVWGVVIGVVIYVVLELYFRFVFMKKLDCIEVASFPPYKTFSEFTEEDKMQKNISKVLVSVLLGVLLIVNLFNEVEDFSTMFTDVNTALLVIFSIVIAGGTFVLAGVILKIVFKQAKAQKKEN